jgi:hypothetical protein
LGFCRSTAMSATVSSLPDVIFLAFLLLFVKRNVAFLD